MKSRHLFLGLFLLFALSGCKSNKMLIAIGTYTDSGSIGIYLCETDGASGYVKIVDSAAQVNPSFLCISPDKRALYAVTETEDSTAGVTAYSIDLKKQKLQKLNSIEGLGSAPCHIATNGSEVITSEYGGGSFTRIGLRADGAITQVLHHIDFNENGTNSDQPVSKIHSAQYDPESGTIYMTDLGRDKMYILKDSIVTDTIAFEHGFAPRHFCFSNDRKWMYVLGERSGKICAAEKAGDSYIPEQYILADTTSGKERIGSADIHISDDGKFLYASNRLGGDGIAVCKILSNGLLEMTGYTYTGSHPRNFTITPDGDWIIVACRDSNTIEFYRRDKISGKLNSQPDLTLRQFKKPVCITILQP